MNGSVSDFIGGAEPAQSAFCADFNRLHEVLFLYLPVVLRSLRLSVVEVT